jgi:hypothetical protein
MSTRAGASSTPAGLVPNHGSPRVAQDVVDGRLETGPGLAGYVFADARLQRARRAQPRFYLLLAS